MSIESDFKKESFNMPDHWRCQSFDSGTYEGERRIRNLIFQRFSRRMPFHQRF